MQHIVISVSGHRVRGSVVRTSGVDMGEEGEIEYIMILTWVDGTE